MKHLDSLRENIEVFEPNYFNLDFHDTTVMSEADFRIDYVDGIREQIIPLLKNKFRELISKDLSSSDGLGKFRNNLLTIGQTVTGTVTEIQDKNKDDLRRFDDRQGRSRRFSQSNEDTVYQRSTSFNSGAQNSDSPWSGRTEYPRERQRKVYEVHGHQDLTDDDDDDDRYRTDRSSRQPSPQSSQSSTNTGYSNGVTPEYFTSGNIRSSGTYTNYPQYNGPIPTTHGY